MRRFVLAMAVFGLSACASVAGLRNKPADVVTNSVNPPAEVGRCIAQGWGEIAGAAVNHAPTSNDGYTVNLPSATTGNNGVADVTLNGQGSHVEARYRLSGLGGYDKFNAVIHRCSS